MMKPTGARPTVRASKDRLVAMLMLHPLQFLRDDIQRLVPRHFDKSVSAAVAVAGFEPPLSDTRPRDAQFVVHRRRNSLQDGRWRFIPRERFHVDQPVTLHNRLECTPVR